MNAPDIMSYSFGQPFHYCSVDDSYRSGATCTSALGYLKLNLTSLSQIKEFYPNPKYGLLRSRVF